MRGTLTLLLLPLFLSVTAQSWAPIGAEWTYKQNSVWGPDSNLAVVRVVGDTLVDGRLCRELRLMEGWHDCHELFALQYESNDSLFAWNANGGNFQLIFRWDAQPGDTWHTVVQPGVNASDTLDWLVLDTGHVMVAGEPLREWTVQIDPRQSGLHIPITRVVERLGPMGSPFAWMHGACDFEIYAGLRCYEDDDIDWLSPDHPQCALMDHTGAVQVDEPWNTWFVARTFPAGSLEHPNFVATRTTRYFFSGAITVDGEPWNRLIAHDTWEDPPVTTVVGAMRQTDQVVLFVDTLGAIDTLYNFNLQVGDSVHYPGISLMHPYLTVEAIDTVMIMDHPHRRFRFSEDWSIMEAYYSDAWIEGMGSIHGPLAPRMPEHLSTGTSGWPDSTRTVCFLRGNDLLWQHPGYSSCTTNVLLGTDELLLPEITLYPNPTQGIVRVVGLPAGQWPYRVLGPTGHVMAEGLFPAGDSPRLLDLGSWPSGLYLLQVDLPGSFSGRFVKD
ncbi:MAG TPA: T9SS type A sorting domain-containing protein [Flavobacteriales bacterium]|nr:T9SS type A sorting domain-containing protein [Flavobacteriales bacterium]